MPALNPRSSKDEKAIDAAFEPRTAARFAEVAASAPGPGWGLVGR